MGFMDRPSPLPAVTLTINDTPYTLRLCMNALCTIEQRSGQSFLDIQRQAAQGHFIAIRWLFFAALQSCHYDVVKTPEEAGTLIDAAGGLDAIVSQINTLLAAATAPPAPDVEQPV